MDMKQLLGAITAMIARIALAAVVIVVVFKLAVSAYDFGFQVFADIPVDEGEGRTVSVTISDGEDTKDIARLLEEKGLIKDAKLFYVQEKLSDNSGHIMPGTYELSTAMSVEEMLKIMSGTDEGQTEETN